jgi:hypothetical protein
MSKKIQAILPVASLVLASLACQTVMGGGSTPVPTETRIPEPTVNEKSLPTLAMPNTGETLLSDNFTSSNWGTGTDADSSIEYANGALQFQVFTENWFTWSTPNDDTYQDVHIEVDAINNDTDSNTALGILCDREPSKEAYYYLAITPGGEYAIAITAEGASDVFLTNNDQWASSDLIATDASSYHIGADCGNGILALYVDGQLIDSVSDSTYTSGEVGLLVWSPENGGHTDVAFDDFVMTALP